LPALSSTDVLVARSMHFTSILGAVGIGMGLVRAVPQLTRLRRAGSARGVSVDTAATNCVVSFGWTIYGVLSDQLAVTLATGASGAVFGMVTLAALNRGRRVQELRAAPMWLVALTVAGGTIGASGLGALLPLSVVVANAPQLLIVFRERDLTELSTGTWLMSFADGLVWGIYALAANVPPILAYGLLQLSTSGVILVRTSIWRRAKILTEARR
jgi:uncharacterized protein with PQ loop repeat